MNPILKRILHIVLFVLAFIVFYLGLGIGLQVNSNAGTALWALALAIVVGNFIWIFRTRSTKQ